MFWTPAVYRFSSLFLFFVYFMHISLIFYYFRWQKVDSIDGESFASGKKFSVRSFVKAICEKFMTEKFISLQIKLQKGI